MRVALNGAPFHLREHATVADAVAAAGGDPERGGLAVAVDGAVVPRSEWQATTLREGQRVEVLTAVQGG